MAEQEQRHVNAKQNMAKAQQFTKSRNLIRIESMLIFKQKIRHGLKFSLRVVHRKILRLR